MFVQFQVEVEIRKGLSEEMITKTFPVSFDDLPNDTSDYEARQMAINEVNTMLYRSEDYRVYGKNWIVTEVYNS